MNYLRESSVMVEPVAEFDLFDLDDFGLRWDAYLGALHEAA